MTQLEDAERGRTDVELQGTTRPTAYLRKIDAMKPGWEVDPEEDPMPEGKYGSWTPANEEPEKINFTKFLTLFHYYPDLMHLTTADGQRAIPMATLGKTKPNTIISETWAKQYRRTDKAGHLVEHVRNTTDLKQFKDWPGEIWKRHQAGQPLRKILDDLSPYPPARNPTNFEATEIHWTEGERRQIGLPEQTDAGREETRWEGINRCRQRKISTKERWAEYEDPMEVDIDLACVNRKGVLPKAILAARTFQIEPGNRETIVEQYRTLWNTDEETWSTAETIIQYMRNAGKGEQESEHELKELIESGQAYSHDAKGKLVGIVTEAKTIELYNMYVQAVGGENEEPTVKQINTRLRYRGNTGST
ncbi:hypothetical protein CYMTET_56055 [Cymbomonas tetramitiformis]|uniref:Uncharacterized protein n=1 Tax=Cymbomonas tetramitiformis TaxID=36881 RepID=A0AAE0EM75_9CHLO|nr:hypothetical protein CYMTET_56055 [Cymbomonas tetramitiformis]